MDDYIKRKDIYKLFPDNGVTRLRISDIDAIPSAKVAPIIRAHWIHCKGKSNLWYCSYCRNTINYNPNIDKKPVYEVNKFCRNCGAQMYEKVELEPCPVCGAKVQVHGPEDWYPTFYDPDSGGDPVVLHCDCGLSFSINSYDYRETYKAWNRRARKKEGDNGRI